MTASPSTPGTVPEAMLIIDLTQTDLPPTTPVYVYVVGLVQTPTGEVYYRLDQNFMPQPMSPAAPDPNAGKPGNVPPQSPDNSQAAGTFPDMGTLSSAAQTALAANYPLAWADWSIPVTVGSNLVLCLGNINTTNMPGLGTGTAAFSARVYVSVGVPRLPFSVSTDAKTGAVNGYTAPVFGNGTGVGGAMTLFDWIEFSYDSEGNFNGNTTQVNQFGFPLYLSGVNTAGTATALQGVMAQSRADIMASVANLPAPFSAANSLVPVDAAAAEAYPAGVTHLRALAPDEISQANDTLSQWFASTVTAAYQAWQSTPVQVTDVSSGTYTGICMPLAQYPQLGPPPGYTYGAIAFYEGSYPTQEAFVTAFPGNPAPAPAFWIGPIGSDDIWQCGGSLAQGSTAQKNIGKILAAAFNRGRVIKADGTVRTAFTDADCSGDAADFYEAGTVFNPWAALFHGVNANGLSYAFAYDDVCDQSTSIPAQGQTLQAASIRIALGPFFTAGVQAA